MWTKRNIHYIALAVGGLGALVEGVSNVDHIAKQTGTLFDPGVMAAAITSIGAAVLLAFTIKAFSQKHVFVGVGLALTLCFTAWYTTSTTLMRTSEARHAALQKIYEKDMFWREMAANVKALSTRTADECGKGAGRLCENNRNAMYLAMGKLEEQQEKLDVMGQQVKWMLSPFVNVSVDTAGRIQPMFLPMALFLLSMFCIAFGERGEWAPPEFDTQLTGKEAELDKARRYIEAYEKNNGVKPAPAAVAKVLQISEFRAKNVMKKVG